ncbi:HNH endonuclease [Billgrantia bachuensis]|uniref:HNH nuclease domain-containing protein n=1 Tax=Billgrantia bachuensis TaxID=2717286 RepID=A0ABX0PS58_9GAMM|nr:hypothetical protein [Halomonas bachuensis]
MEGRTIGAHRVAYCKANGLQLASIDGLVVRHKCDNKSCVNPAHLEVGDHSDNIRDAIERGRYRGNYSGKKFTLLGPDGLLHDFIGQKAATIATGLSQGTISSLVCGRSRSCKGWSLPPGMSEAKPGLTVEKVRAIRARFVWGCKVNGPNALAREYGVSRSAITSCVKGITWGYVS